MDVCGLAVLQVTYLDIWVRQVIIIIEHVMIPVTLAIHVMIPVTLAMQVMISDMYSRLTFI